MEETIASAGAEAAEPKLTRNVLLRRVGLGAGMALAASALASTPTMSIAKAAAVATRRSAVPTRSSVVLVHGAFADGSSWSKVIQRVQAGGHDVVAVQLGLTGLGDDIAVVRSVLAAQSGPTVLVGHS